MRAAVHGDDFTILGSEVDLNWFRKKINEKFEVKIRGGLVRIKRKIKQFDC